MNKNYILSLGILFSGVSMSAQTASKTDKKTPTETSNVALEIVYCIDGVITKSPLDFLKIKQENIYSIAIVNDKDEIAKKYARKGEFFKSVIVVQTAQIAPNPKPTEAVVSGSINGVKSKKN
jgi:hypothetical protein